MKKYIKNKYFAVFTALIAMFLWGSAFPVLKLTNEELQIAQSDYYSKIYVAGLRFLLSGIIVFVLMLFVDKKSVPQLVSNLPFLFTLGLLSVSIAYFFFYIGVGNTSGMKSAILTSSSSFFVVIFSHFILKNEEINKKKIFAIFIGMIGIIILNIDKGFDFNFKWDGEFFIIVNSIVSALSTIYVKKYGTNISAFVKTAGQMLIGSIILIAVGYLGLSQRLIFTPNSVLLVFYASIISSVAFILWYYLLSEYKASEITFLRLFIPFFGTILSGILLNENLNISIFLGLLFVIIGIIVVNKSN